MMKEIIFKRKLKETEHNIKSITLIIFIIFIFTIFSKHLILLLLHINSSSKLNNDLELMSKACKIQSYKDFSKNLSLNIVIFINIFNLLF